jgi:tripartite-type tricarboxylate transporter receptor subunit TctC
VRAPADGQTILFVTAANAINATLYEKLNFNFLRDIAPVAGVFRMPIVLAVNSEFSAKSVPEFIAYAKSNPGKISFGSGGIGTAAHVGGELFKMMAGVDMVHVPYRGSVAVLADLLGGRLQAAFDPLPSSLEHIRSGKLRALAVTTEVRSQNLPAVPAIGEFLTGYEASAWAGMGTPRQTPQGIVEMVNVEIMGALNDRNTKVRLADIGVSPFVSSPAAFGKFLSDETEKWAKVVKFSGAKPD